MTYNELLELMGPAWQELPVYNIGGVPHWIGCEVVGLLGIKNVTNAIKGTTSNRKLSFPAYRMHRDRSINPKRSVYMLTMDGIILVIKNNSSQQCRELQAILTTHGI